MKNDVDSSVMSAANLPTYLSQVENDSKNKINRVKKSLYNHLGFWKEIETFDSVLNIIEQGYRLSFVTHPPTMHFRNNSSAIENKEFVTQEIQDLVNSGRAVEVPCKPYIVSPLSVAQNREKKRLILDLSRLNVFIKKEKVKYEDWKIAVQYFESKCFMTKFDLQSGYHHIDINSEFQTFLGFSWNQKFYCYTVLPFGLSSSPFVFTKCLRPLVKHWRKNHKKVVLYLDDGLVISKSFSSCEQDTDFIKNSLVDAGFHINFKKSVLSPVQDLEWLGLCWDSIDFSLYIPQRRISDTREYLARVVSLLPRITARQLACFTGKIISMSPVMGNVVRLMTRRCYKAIESRSALDKVLMLDAVQFFTPELHFWSINLEKYNRKHLKAQFKKDIVVYSDASNVAGAAFTVELNEKIFHMTWSDHESKLSSTWRELKAIEQALLSFSTAFNSFAANFLTILFSQCHIYFNCNGHSGKSSA